MTWKQLFTSSIGKKFLMGATGFFLLIYLIVHASINAMIFYNDGGVTFNKAAFFMSRNFFMRFLEIGLFVVFILHIIQGLILWNQNRQARKINYEKYNYPPKIKWYSRYMGWLGTFILLFLIMHLTQFWAGTKNETGPPLPCRGFFIGGNHHGQKAEAAERTLSRYPQGCLFR